MNINWLRSILILSMLGFFAIACTNNANDRFEAKVPLEKLDLPPGEHSSIEWLPDGKLIISIPVEDTVNVQNRRKYFIYFDGQLQEIPLAVDPLCRWQNYLAPTSLPDGRLGLAKNCAGRWPDKPPGLDMAAYLMGYDFDTGITEQIVSEPLPEGLGLSGTFSWNPDMSRGVVAGGSLFGTLYWVTPTGSMPMTVTVGEGSDTWSLAENFRVMQNRENNAMHIGVAKTPAWSHDGNTIAFFASPEAVGRSGQSRVTGSYNLYLMDPDTLQPEVVLSDLYFPHLLEWSPDDNWLLLSAEAGSKRVRGLWLFSRAESSLQLIAQGSFRDINWSPDGQKIAAIKCEDICIGQNEILILDVSELAQNGQE
ncbi:MAG: PD40 domain-containing protein [Ardenticatenaceae bacterium]|nr:PD40 domain-containing protein [Ardenticatenaceae bacterium]